MTQLRKSPVLYAGLAYVAVRVLSFLTWTHPLANETIATALAVGFFILCRQNLRLAWIVMVSEFLLDGSGHFFELRGFLLRTWFLVVFAIHWLLVARKKMDEIRLSRSVLYTLFVFAAFFAWSVVNAFWRGNEVAYLLQDAILYLFLLVLFPALHMKETLWKLVPVVKAYIIGSALFSLYTFVFYSGGLGRLPDAYYHWFRNVASGKITDLGQNFFRIVLPEHILLVPITLILANFLIKNPRSKNAWAYIILSALTLAINFTRIYFVALAVGLIVLFVKENWKRWLAVSFAVPAIICALFISVFFAASRGESLGLELLGLRAAGALSPSADVSGAIRLAILPEAMKIIKENLWLGTGLGTSVTFFHPVTKIMESRTQFDWGYLEQWAELGIFGLMSYILLLAAILYSLARNSSLGALGRGLLSGGVALFVVNITTPALFQGFGVLYFAFLLAFCKSTPR